MESIQIRSFPGPYFPTFKLNTEIYEVDLRIQSEHGKVRTKKKSVFGHFPHSADNNTLNIENITIKTSKSVKLLGIVIDNKLNFVEYISVLSIKASLHLNAISRLQKYMEKRRRGNN